MTPKPPSRVLVWGLPAALLVLEASTWITFSEPWEPDESRYLEIAREMASGGDWLVPTLNGVPYLEKPPLYIWSLAALFKLFGPSVPAGRALSLLAGAGTVLLTTAMARLAGGRTLALRTGLILASTPFFLALSSVVTIDMLLCFWVTAAIAGFAYGTTGDPRGRPWRRTILLGAYVALALAVLTKGPVALAVPGLVWIFWRPMGPRRILPPCFLGGIALLIAVALPWFLLVQWKIPSFWDFFFVRGHLGRFIGDEADNVNFHDEPWHYYLPILLGGAAPWTVYLAAPPAAAGGGLREELACGSWGRLAWSWLLPGLLFFSVVSGKLPTYILPLFPAVALLAALRWDEGNARPGRLAALTAFSALAGLACVIGVAVLRAAQVEVWWAEYVNWRLAYPVLCLFLSGLAVAAWNLRRGRMHRAFQTIVVSLAMLLIAGGYLKGPVDRAISVDDLAQAVNAVSRPDDAFVCVNKYLPLFAFCLQRPIFVCGERGELDYGAEELRLRPDLFWDFPTLKTRLDGPGRVFMVVSRRRLPRLESLVGRKLHHLGSTRNAFLLSNQLEPWPFRPGQLEQQ